MTLQSCSAHERIFTRVNLTTQNSPLATRHVKVRYLIHPAAVHAFNATGPHTTILQLHLKPDCPSSFLRHRQLPRERIFKDSPDAGRR